jgi:hypothetical protein
MTQPPITDTFTPVYHPDGGFNVMIGFSIDLTDSKKAQQDILKIDNS